MKKIATWVGVFCCMTSSFQAQNKIMNTSIYQYVVADINGDDFDFSSLKGKKIMVVNTASKCGLTPQYKKLQALYDRFKDSGFVVIGFPSNNFLWQEPGTNEDINTFCEKNYGVSFPMMSKINVKGSKKHPVYQFLTQKNKNGLRDSSVSWNFQKYLIDEEGQLVDVVGPRTQPDDEKILNWIKS
ncbi:MAG: glutathione peroxidase [Flavobacteriaceae bacterium]|nr:glutathione peroxidase [Flavobacteriaceae bacterium]